MPEVDRHARRGFLGTFILLGLAASAQEANVVTGTATYRERIALPPDAVFEATLEDVSRMDAPAAIIGRARLEKPGQPPFKFAIQYDPARVVEGRSYSVRARIVAGDKRWFVTDRAYPVLTKGHSKQVSMRLVRSAGSGAGRAANSIGALPASFGGELPCADCAGIRYILNLFPDKSFFLRRNYIRQDATHPFDDIGNWELTADGSRLVLRSGKEPVESFAVMNGAGVLRKLDLQGREIDSKLNYDLRRMPAFEPIEPRLQMSGMFRYMADAATFTECHSRQRWPVAMEAGYQALEAEYLKHRRQPGEELMVTLEGQVASRPNMDTGRPVPNLIVERYIGAWPGETCGAPLATSPLQETYWKLTRLEGKPVIVAEKQREPSLVFRSEGNRVTGFSGCNNLTGAYSLKGAEISFNGVAATRMACIQGMDTEAVFLPVLGRVRTWKILGEHLELYDASSKMLARFEARALK
jgi:copper homeostasis protein (lipoprotein)